MGQAKGSCEECGGQFLKVNRLRKYCTGCQILNDMSYRPGHKAKCAECHTEFFPVRTSYRVCNDCREWHENKLKWPPCEKCGRHFRPAPVLGRFCMSCVQRTRANRDGYIAALKALMRRRAADPSEALRMDEAAEQRLVEYREGVVS